MKYHRKSIRLNDFDYSNDGYYFVTICVQNKSKLFWEINNNHRADTPVRPYINCIGLMINYWFGEISNHFENIILDEYIIMPDHIHFILIIKNVGVDRRVDPKPLGNIIQWFKTMTTNNYLKEIKQNNWPRFDKRLWQRNYYERIIRSEKEYLMIKKYIEDNPIKFDKPKTPPKGGV